MAGQNSNDYGLAKRYQSTNLLEILPGRMPEIHISTAIWLAPVAAKECLTSPSPLPGPRLEHFLYLREAAIDKQLNSGNKAAVIGCQKHGSLGNLIRVTQPAKRYGRANAVQSILPSFTGSEKFTKPFRVYRAGADGIHTYAAGFKISGPGASERAHRRFGGGIDAVCRQPFAANYRCIENDGCTIRQQRQGLLYGKKQAFDVAAKDAVEMRFVNAPQWSVFCDACIGKNNIELALGLS